MTAGVLCTGYDPDEVAATSRLPGMYVFPCGMCFHVTCLLESSVPRLGRSKRTECVSLMDKLEVPKTIGLVTMRRRLGKRLSGGRVFEDQDDEPRREGTDAVARLDEILRERCPFCDEVEFSG